MNIYLELDLCFPFAVQVTENMCDMFLTRSVSTENMRSYCIVSILVHYYMRKTFLSVNMDDLCLCVSIPSPREAASLSVSLMRTLAEDLFLVTATAEML